MSNQTQKCYSIKERLNLFLTRTNEIRNSQLIKRGFKLSFTINSNFVEKSLNVSSFEPDEDDLRSFLTIYRKFISEKSPIFIYRIFNICRLYLKNEKLNQNVIEVRKLWGNEFKNGLIKLNLNDKRYKPEEILDLWINAVYFHDDLEKINLLESLMPNILSYTFVRQSFLSLILETTKQILYVSSVIEFGLKQNYFENED